MDPHTVDGGLHQTVTATGSLHYGERTEQLILPMLSAAIRLCFGWQEGTICFESKKSCRINPKAYRRY